MTTNFENITVVNGEPGELGETNELNELNETTILNDILGEIFSNINCGSTYKSATLVCSQWRTMAQKIHPHADTIFANHLTTLIKLMPEYNFFQHELIFANPNITHDFLEKHSIPKNYRWLSSNPNTTIDIIKDNIDCEWDWYDVSSNASITVDMVESNLNLPWEWIGLSSNPNLTWDFISKHRDKQWNFYDLSMNPNITLDIVKENMDFPWKWTSLISNSSINVGDLKMFKPNLNIIPTGFNSNITWDTIYDFRINNPEDTTLDMKLNTLCKNINLRINMNDLIFSPSLTYDMVESRLVHKSLMKFISCNPNTTEELIEKYVKQNDENLDWGCLSNNKKLTWKIIVDNVDKPWRYDIIVSNKFNYKKY